MPRETVVAREYDTALAVCAEALARARLHNSVPAVAGSLDTLGFIDHRTRHHRRAVIRHRRAVDLFRSFGGIAGAVGALEHLGHAHSALGERELARSAWLEAIDLYRQMRRDTEVRRMQDQIDGLD